QKLQCIRNLHALAARGLIAENGLQTRAKRRQHMRRMAVAILAIEQFQDDRNKALRLFAG
ncbi:MAG: hypothetical protein ACLPKT_19240, partial [Methylocella sp.]